jgi:hypothetical protein
MDEVLDGTPELIGIKLKARYEPLRDSRAFCEPELAQRKLFRGTGNLLAAGGMGLEALLLIMGQLSTGGALFGLGVTAIGLKFLQKAREPLKFEPPEPLENLAPLSQGQGLCKVLMESFPNLRMQLDPIEFVAKGSCDGYDWQLRVERETLKPLPRDEAGYETYMAVSEGPKSTGGRIWNRSPSTVHRHRIVWKVTVADEYTPRPGQPSQYTSLECHETVLDKNVCTFTLPINHHDQPGLGHEGRTDFVSSPLGLHHPEFVGEQIALSLVWMFKPRL